MRHALLLILLSSVLLLNKNAEGRKRAASPLMHKQRHAWLAQLRELDPNILTDPDQIAAGKTAVGYAPKGHSPCIAMAFVAYVLE